MAIYNAPSWPAQRPRSASMPARPEVAAFAAPRLNASDLNKLRARAALDLDMRGLRGGHASTFGSARHQELHPVPRPQNRRTSFAELEAERNDVVAAQAPVAWPPAQTLPHEQEGSPTTWPWGDVTLLRGGHERFVLHREGRIAGANSGISLFSYHDERAFGPGSAGPTLYGVVKTFALQDVKIADTRTMLAADPEHVEREVNNSLITGRDNAPERLFPPSPNLPFRQLAGSSGLGMARPRMSLAELANSSGWYRASSAVEPLAVLRQIDTQGEYKHVLYPLSRLDGRQFNYLLRDQALSADERRACLEQLGHALLDLPLQEEWRLQRAGRYHQDIKPENILFSVDWSHRRRGSGELWTLPKWTPRAHLVDFGLTTSNQRGAVPSGTLHTHAPQTFLPGPAAELAIRNGRSPYRTEATSFSRREDEAWAFGILLFRTLTSHLPGPHSGDQAGQELNCPLVPAYHLDTRTLDPVTGMRGSRHDPQLLQANADMAQALLSAWQPVHAAWSAYDLARADHPFVAQPTGHRLPTPNGARIDEALAIVASMEFNFLSFVLRMTAPESRDPFSSFVGDYNAAKATWQKMPAYRNAMEVGRTLLVSMMQANAVGFAQLAAQQTKRAHSAEGARPQAGAKPRRHWEQAGAAQAQQAKMDAQGWAAVQAPQPLLAAKTHTFHPSLFLGFARAGQPVKTPPTTASSYAVPQKLRARSQDARPLRTPPPNLPLSPELPASASLLPLPGLSSDYGSPSIGGSTPMTPDQWLGRIAGLHNPSFLALQTPDLPGVARPHKRGHNSATVSF